MFSAEGGRQVRDVGSQSVSEAPAPNHDGEHVARWVLDIAAERADAELELVDLRNSPLPHLDESNRITR